MKNLGILLLKNGRGDHWEMVGNKGMKSWEFADFESEGSLKMRNLHCKK